MIQLVFVLNANYEPINTCSLQRAMGLLLLDKAILVENGRGYIHTAISAYPRPSIIIAGGDCHLQVAEEARFHLS